MDVGTRVVSEEPRTLYPGDIIEGALAQQQVAAGNASCLPEPEAEAAAEAQPEEEKPARGANYAR